MPLSLSDVRRLAVDIAREEDSALEVLAAINAEGATDYAEIILAPSDRGSKAGRVVLGVSRKAQESEARSSLRDGLREHLRARA